MTPEDAERWIVNLIRNARLDAKIDSKLVCIAGLRINTLISDFSPFSTQPFNLLASSWYYDTNIV